MTEGTTAIAVEQASPAIETQQPETDTDEIELKTSDNEGDEQDLDGSETEGDDAGDGEGTEQEPELVEVEFNGKTYKVHPDLTSGLMKNADYTQKTQGLAEEKRAVDARMAEVEANYAVSQEVLEGRAALMNIDAQLQQYQNVNWQQLEQEDPMAAMSHWRQFQQLEKQRGQVAGYLNEQHTMRAEKAEQEIANRLRQTREFAEKEIKGWSPELDNKITQFATTDLGLGIDEMRRSYNPTLYKALYLAYLGQQALAKQAVVPKPTTQIKPLTTVSSKANPAARKSITDMSMEEYATHRKAQLAKAGR